MRFHPSARVLVRRPSMPFALSVRLNESSNIVLTATPRPFVPPFSASSTFFAANDGPASMSMYTSLHVPLQLVPVRRIGHITLFELRSSQP